MFIDVLPVASSENLSELQGKVTFLEFYNIVLF